MGEDVPIIEKDKYPVIDTMYFELMKMESYLEEAKKVVFPYVIKQTCSWYIDIYVYLKENDTFDRYIIAKGMKMSEDDEKKYLNVYSEQEVCFSQRVFDFFMKEIWEVAPELNVELYRFKKESIIHAYYASFPSGVRES